ncbi:hypothetical protein DEVEQU_01558 [Devosia equisanguinis]|uniref:Uncharacterized protein n=1 Tax=Devosia equisanguinis TaxID=2490941 RepID=A0A3S4GJH4_9HYPH|nr:hypothetical protein [Devosia equisanguinis]VDS04423.1 hypothetical protein DEVEQU_01558 [Devosia equisanguinis]
MGWLIFAVIAAGAYGAYRLKGRWDMELVRSHVFLDALTTGEPPDEANGTAMVVLALPSVKGILHLARLHVLNDFGGQRGTMIEKAYSLGMMARLTAYEREFFGVKSPAASSANMASNQPSGTGESNEDKAQADSDEAFLQSLGETSLYRFYYYSYVEELKRLAGTPEGKIHPVELCDDENVKHAFVDRIDPLRLAEMVHITNYATLRHH